MSSTRELAADGSGASSQGVRSIGRAVALMRLMASPKRVDWSLDELSKQSALPKSTVHRLLDTMTSLGLAEPGARPGFYRLGLQAAVLGSAAMRLRQPNVMVQEILRSVRDQTEETTGIVVLAGDHAVTVARVASLQPLRWDSEVGGIYPAHASAGGKLLLSRLSEDEVRSRFPGRERLPKFTANTIGTLDALIEHLGVVREAGYATDDEEYRDGLFCIAVPIPEVGTAPAGDGGGQSERCVGISAPAVRAGPLYARRVMPILESAALDLADCFSTEIYS